MSSNFVSDSVSRSSTRSRSKRAAGSGICTSPLACDMACGARRPGPGQNVSCVQLSVSRAAVRASRKDRHYHLFVERFSRLLPLFPVPAIDGFECSFSAPVPERKSHWQSRNQDNSVRRIIASSSLILPAAIPSAPAVGAAGERPRWLRAAAGLCSSLSGCYMSLSISANFLRA